MRSPRKGAPLIYAAVSTIVGISAFAITAYAQPTTTADSSPPPAAGTQVTVPGTQIGVLLPGEKAYVTLALTNPHANVKAKLQPISAGDVVIDTVADHADKPYCHDQIELSTVGADPLPTLEPKETNHLYKIIDAVKLKVDTDIRCQGMTYHTTWFTHFKPAR